ncbi:MAG TPA: M23 family metallopeptidase [Burkholderiaceae bacterium]|nr:M23 family metallopeptidase [Burkholderiaceae bacterium]
MQIMITHGSMARTRVLQFSRWQLVALAAVLAVLLMLLSGAVYHFIFLKAAREGWPVVSQVVRLVVRDEFAQRDRYVRENLDAMAQKVGEIQAKVLKLEAMGDRVSGLAGVKPEEFRGFLGSPAPAASAPAATRAGQGGPFIPALLAAFAPAHLATEEQRSFGDMTGRLAALDVRADVTTDLFTLIESRLLEGRLAQLLVPSTQPVEGPVGSGFGFRIDPFSGRSALHTGLDFPADVGTPILAAAGGMVVAVDTHPEYGRLLELDHGNGLMTRYAHLSKTLVKAGDLVKRGQPVAQVGNSGRSTGPHLHFEVLVNGVPQNPARFLAGRGGAPGRSLAAAPGR